MSTAVMTGQGLEGAEGGDLARRIAAAEPGAFEQFVALYEPRVQRLAHRLLGWGDGAEDVVQDVFLAALRKAGTFRGDASLWTWLTVITLNRCRTHRKRRLLRLRVHGLLSRQEPKQVESSDRPAIDDESARQVRMRVAALPPKDREVIVLFYLERRSAVQIGELLSISRNAVEVRLHRARAKLKQSLQGLMKD
jgi:RNA polymerase sigma factor (sigma-70 family)